LAANTSGNRWERDLVEGYAPPAGPQADADADVRGFDIQS
jgi:hypothetical protein